MKEENNALTKTVISRFLDEKEKGYLNEIYLLMDHDALNELAEKKSLHSGTFRQSVRNQLAEIRTSKLYKLMLNKPMNKKITFFERLIIKIYSFFSK